MPKRVPKLVQVQLRNDGDDIETPWAQDLGPAKNAPAGSRRVRLVNVPFFHAKPTWGDVIVVTPFTTEPFLMWDGAGIAFSKIDTRIVEDGGRYAMIVHFLPKRGVDGRAAFDALARAGRGRAKHAIDADIVSEAMTYPGDGEPGRAYLAVKDELEPSDVMARLVAAKLPCTVTQIHPALPKAKPAKAKAAKSAKAAKAKPAKAAKPTKPAKKAKPTKATRAPAKRRKGAKKLA